MKKSLLLIALLASQALAVSVDFYDEQQNNPSATGIRLRINNDSNYPISNAKLRYYFHKSSQPYAVDGYYLANAAMTVNDINDDLAYFEIAVPSVPAGYYPDMAGFSLALHNADWSGRDKTLDYSYQVSASLAENSKVVLLSGDDILFGVSPDVQSMSAPGILKISGLRFSTNAWLELKNIGTSVLNLSEYQIIDANNSVFSINESLEAGEIFRICQNQTACGNVNKSQILSNLSWGSDGEILLKQNDVIVSYVAWGQPGTQANDAVNAGVWSDAQAFFPAESQVQSFNADYTKDAFFRLKSNKSGMNIDDWFGFTDNDDPAETVSVPLPIKISANKPVIKQIPGDDEVLFSWLPVQGVDSYRVIVRDQNNNDVYNLNTPNSSVSLSLTQGLYSWTVIGEDEFQTMQKSENGDRLLPNVDNIDIVKANINTSLFKQLKIHKIKARRDTRMLDLNYLKQTDKYSWDRPNMDAGQVEGNEGARCWAIATEVMNHFYGGNLTQDEIVYHGLYIAEDPLLSPFRPQGGIINYDKATETFILDPETGEPTGSLVETLKWALKVDRLNFGVGAPSYQTVKTAIDNNKIIFVNIPGHSMVIYGYVGDASNHAFYFAFGNNNGGLTTSLNYDGLFENYFIPDAVFGNVEMSDPRVHMDSDGDGVTDFEEEERFCVDMQNEKKCIDKFLLDSDDDGIEDKREIYNYTTRAESGFTNRAVTGIYDDFKFAHNLYEIRESYDKNKNGIPAELDPDDNDDGIDDGLYNYNETSTKKYNYDMDIPDDYTIFGREYVRINDRVKCYNTQIASDSYCGIASSDEDIFAYGTSYSPIVVGAYAHVGNVDFVNRGTLARYYPNVREKIIFRNFAEIHGNVKGYIDNTFVLGVPLSEYVSMQNGVSVHGSADLQSGLWTHEFIYVYSTPMPIISVSRTKIVHNGETYRLKDGDAFSTLRVEAGGTLVIEPGEMFIDKEFQLESYSAVRFAEPGRGTILHTNGDIIWRAYNSEPASNTQYWTNVARGFKLVHHSAKGFYIGSVWAGTIYAPKAKVVMGQVDKTIYGRILGRDVIVHQNSNVYRVDFNPTDATQVAFAF